MDLDFRRMFRYRFGLLIAMTGVLVSACSTPPETRVDVQDTATDAAVIEAVQTDIIPGRSTITFVCSKSTTHGDPFAVANPARITFDIKGTPAGDLIREIRLETGPVKEIFIKEKADGTAGVVVYVRQEVNHPSLIIKGKDIILEITPRTPEKKTPEVQPAPGDEAAASLAQILGVTVTQRKGNRTRLSIRTDKEVKYDVKLDGKVLLIDLKNGSIQPGLIKALDSEHAAGAVSRVRAFYSALDRHVSLRVMLRKLVPYHIARDGKALNIDFDAIPVEIPGVVEQPAAAALPEKAGPEMVNTPLQEKKTGPAETESRAGRFEASSKQYAGERMSFDFVDTDIRNILQLISEVADLNIVWGADVEGKISMKLDDIPWDQALEMILKPNGLTYQIEDDVVWVVPKEKLRDMEIKEGKRKGALLAAKRLQGIFEAKIIEFITIRNRKAADIYKMLVGDPTADPPIAPALDIEAAESKESEEGEEETGKKIKIIALDLYLSYDPGTNVIIANGVRAKVDKVKELVAKLDVAEKQVMIEARVVEASTGFARELGIAWQNAAGTVPGVVADWYDSGSWGSSSFSTSPPQNPRGESWTPNIGLALGWLTGAASVSLDASLALAQSDGELNIISAPKVMTVNGGEAYIARGTTQYIGVATLDTQTIQEKEAMLSLRVVPTVSADGQHVTMNVTVRDEQPISPTNSPNSYGGKTGKDIETTMMVRTGDTVVIGGIFQKEESVVDSGVPWLKDIPLLGWLFKAQIDDILKTELLIFLTPTIVDALMQNEEN